MLEGCVPFPPEFAERYRREDYWRGKTLGEHLAHHRFRQGALP